MEEGRVAQALQIANTIPSGDSYAHPTRMLVMAIVGKQDPRAAIELDREALTPYLSKTGRGNYEQILLYVRLMYPLYRRLDALDEW
jgi:hypothetical protein